MTFIFLYLNRSCLKINKINACKKMDLRKRKDKPILQIKTRKPRKPKLQISNVPLVVAGVVAEAQTELVVEARTELVVEAQTELVAEAQTELVVEARTELVAEAQTELVADMELDPEPHMELEPQTEVESVNIESDEIETKIKRTRASYKVINTFGSEAAYDLYIRQINKFNLNIKYNEPVNCTLCSLNIDKHKMVSQYRHCSCKKCDLK